jgi:hypothetical protein
VLTAMTVDTVEEELPRRKFGFSWQTLLKLLVSAGLLAILFSRTDSQQLVDKALGVSPAWLGVALVLYLVMLVASVWRWRQLLQSQAVEVPTGRLLNSYLVATFFNNFLPSNIGGDVIRIRDTVSAAGSRTLATTIVLIDRAMGLLGLLAVAALATSTLGAGPRPAVAAPVMFWAPTLLGATILTGLVAWPGTVRALLTPLGWFQSAWVDLRVDRLVTMFSMFRRRPAGVFNCFVGAVVVQVVLVAFYMAVAVAAHIPVSFGHLAVLVPVSFLIQMLPLSMNGFGVREATFAYYFQALHLPTESALLLSLLGAATIMVFSLTGAAAYVVRRPEA